MGGNSPIDIDYSKIEFGDFQTPEHFSDWVCNYLKNNLRLSPTVIFEPTCGIGNFLVSVQKIFNPQKVYGVEINTIYFNKAKERVNKNVILLNRNLFTYDFKEIKDSIGVNDRLLIIGNPPWVNNSTLSVLGSENLPVKSNFKGLKGLDALTGSSNFDICEYIILQLIDVFKNTNTTIAMLCKTIVARNIFQELKRNTINFDICNMITFEAKKIFKVSTDACLFIINLTYSEISLDCCTVCDMKNPEQIKYSFGYKKNKFYASLMKNCEDLDGSCCFEWRQGIKHDCSKIMELTKTEKGYLNGNNENVRIEETFIYPLIKSSHIKSAIIKDFKKYVIVTQKKVKEDTSYIALAAPMTWNYLNANIEIFRKRKSSIYNNSPEFSMFGIGDYSYSKYKVGISGFCKIPIFTLLYNEKPIMMDDTCYFLNFKYYDNAYVAMLILNSDLVQEFLKSIAFMDSKRPYTKKILERIDFKKVFTYIDLDDLKAVEIKLNLQTYITKAMFMQFMELVI